MTSLTGMLSVNFYTLIGALEAAHYFIQNYFGNNQANRTWYESLAGVQQYGAETGLTRVLNLNSETNPATGDPFLDPDPGTVREPHARLLEIKTALLDAESRLSVLLYTARAMPSGGAQEDLKKKAWNDFNEVLRDQSFVVAGVVRRLIWKPVEGKAGRYPGTGAPEWEMMEKRLRRILQAFAAVSRGGGDPGQEPVMDLPGIGGSSDGSISF